MKRFTVLALAVGLLGLGGVSSASHGPGCSGGDSFSGSFDASLEGDWVMVPFEVPAHCHRILVTLDHEQTPAPGTPVPGVPIRHTLDLAVYEPAPDGRLWARREFRGYGGSGETDVTITEGGQTTRGFTPGRIPKGTWAVELGLASIASLAEGDDDGRVDWDLDISWTDAKDITPWVTAPYPEAPRDPDPGWYAGDFHVHGPHSNDAQHGWQAMFDAAFDPPADGGAGLDFIAMSDHNVTRQWAEIGAQGDLPADKLVIRSAEVTTYRGHVNAHAAGRWVDYRTGAIHELDPATGQLTQRRGPMAPGAPGGIFAQVHEAEGWTQVNHPTTFPSPVPGVGDLCRGCPWEYSDEETDWQAVDAMEIATGPAGTPRRAHGSQPFDTPTDGTLGPNPFTPLAIEWWDRLQREGHDVTAVGSSDWHRPPGSITESPIGEATTVVYAPELSEAGIGAGVRAGHAYVKLFGNDGPDLRLTATPLLGGPQVRMGDELATPVALFEARVFNATLPDQRPGPLTVLVMRDGVPFLTVPVVGDDFSFSFLGVAPGDYRLQVMRGTAIEALTNPINLVLP